MDVIVPDIGDFKDVPVIEVLVKPGDRVKKNDSLVTLESEKASMEVPSNADGVVEDVKVKVGDKVSQGSVLVILSGTPEGRVVEGSTRNGPSTEFILSNVEGAQSASDGDDNTSVIELKVPDIGDFKDVPVIDVSVKPGDTVKKEAPLVTLESEKASMDVPSSADGTIEDVRVKGGKVSQGMVIATLRTSSVILSGGAQSAPQSKDRDESSPSTTPNVPSTTLRSTQDDTVAQRSGAPVHASPAIRRFARELGVDLQTVRGTGPNGRITREDVQSYVKGALKGGTASSAAGGSSFAGLPAWPKIDFAQFGAVERQPLPRIKKFSGPNLHRNWLSIPHITNYDEADITELEAFRNEINAENVKRNEPKLTMLAFLVKACVAALQRFPEFNSSLEGDELILKRYYHIGFAADTPNGLVVPVIKDANTKGLLEIARESAELAAKARDGKLGMSDMQGSSFTISSIGGIGGTQFTQIVNAPEVAILGATRAAMKPLWDGSAFVPRLMLPISVSYDHRVIDGAGAARFLVYLASLLADFKRVLL